MHLVTLWMLGLACRVFFLRSLHISFATSNHTEDVLNLYTLGCMREKNFSAYQTPPPTDTHEISLRECDFCLSYWYSLMLVLLLLLMLLVVCAHCDALTLHVTGMYVRDLSAVLLSVRVCFGIPCWCSLCRSLLSIWVSSFRFVYFLFALCIGNARLIRYAVVSWMPFGFFYII